MSSNDKELSSEMNSIYISKNYVETEIPYIQYNNIEIKTYKLSFRIEFGKGIDSTIDSSDNRLNFKDKDKYQIDKLEFNNGTINYRVTGYEGPIITKISNIYIVNNNEDSDYEYKYGIGFALDKEQPKYYNDIDSEPYNIERDGKMWHVPGNNDKEWGFDQNARALYQLNIKFAKNEGDEMTNFEKLYGMEETTKKTGLFFITITIVESKNYKVRSKGTTRGATRGATRSISNARVGYGSEATTSSKKSEYEYIDVPKIIIPIRFKIYDDSEITNTIVSKDLESRSKVKELQEKFEPMDF